jgi:hypothetical protein
MEPLKAHRPRAFWSTGKLEDLTARHSGRTLENVTVVKNKQRSYLLEECPGQVNTKVIPDGKPTAEDGYRR